MTDSILFCVGNFIIISASAITTMIKNKKLPNTIKQRMLNKAENSHSTMCVMVMLLKISSFSLLD